MKENEPQIEPGGCVRLFNKETGELVHQTWEAEYSIVTMAEEYLGLEDGEKFITDTENYFHTKFPDCVVCIK